MTSLALAATGFVALAHVFFMVLECVLWTQPAGLRAFGQTAQDAKTTRVLAFNQGMYNGGIAVLLSWAVLAQHRPAVIALLIYVLAMGLVGGITANRSILLYQGMPAALALLLQVLAR